MLQAFFAGVLCMSFFSCISYVISEKVSDGFDILWALVLGPASWAWALIVLVLRVTKKIVKHIKYRSILVDPKDNSLWVVPVKYTNAMIEVYDWKFPHGDLRTQILGGSDVSARYCPSNVWKSLPKADKKSCKRAYRVFKDLSKKGFREEAA